jgi:hypothetical protein
MRNGTAWQLRADGGAGLTGGLMNLGKRCRDVSVVDLMLPFMYAQS